MTLTGLAMTNDTGAVLKKTPLFANLTTGELQALAARTSRKRFQQGEHLFAEGDPCTGLFLVASGKIRIFKLSATGREQVLAVEGPGSSFAELPVFDGGNYPAAASALEDTEVLFTTVRQRLIALILRLTQSDGTPSKEGIRVELTKSHQDLAAELGTVRELVSRNLSRLQAEGFLDVEGRKIVVKDLPGLKREQTSAE